MDQETAQQAQVEATTTLLIEDLAPIGRVTASRRLNSWALFEDDVMFGFVEADGTIYFRTSAKSAERFHALGSQKHPEMPYWSVPAAAASNVRILRELAYQAADNAHVAASFGIGDVPTSPSKTGLFPTAGALARTVVLLAA